MHNPHIAFEIGKFGRRGRSVRGQVTPTAGGYEFKADLYRHIRPDFYTCNTVILKIDRPFDAFDFAFFAHMVSIEPFETNSRDVGLRAGRRADIAALKEIHARFSVVPEPGEEPSRELVADIASLEEQLETIRKREALQLAFAQRHSANETAKQRGPSAEDLELMTRMARLGFAAQAGESEENPEKP